jgi:outer membrane biosynthesis protein TonB
MSLMPSLCAALERAGGDRLVMRAGERPHVLAGDRRHDVASAVLSVNAVEALAEQNLSSAGRHELATNGAISEVVHSTSFPRPLTARAERVGDDFCIELIVSVPLEATAQAEPPPEIVSASAEEAPVDTPAAEPEPPEPVAVVPAPEQRWEPEPIVEETVPEPEPVVEAAYPQPEPVRRPEVTVVTRVKESPTRQARPSVSAPQDLFTWIGLASDLGATTL